MFDNSFIVSISLMKYAPMSHPFKIDIHFHVVRDFGMQALRKCHKENFSLLFYMLKTFIGKY